MCKKLFFLLFLFSNLTANQVILIYGPSCSGKSTYAHELENQTQFKRLDWDDYADLVGEAHASKALTEEINALRREGYNLIIDSQPCFDYVGDNVTKILIYTPLQNLIERDEKRNLRLNREEKRRFYARSYIYNTFFQLFSVKEGCQFVDQIDLSNIEDDISKYSLEMESLEALKEIVPNKPLKLYTKHYYDSIIRN